MSGAEIPWDWAPQVLLGVAIVVGTLMCFFGGRLFRLALGIAGFAGGAVLAAYIAWRMTAPADQVHAATAWPDIILAMLHAANGKVLLVWSITGGIAGALLSIIMQWVGVFVLGVWLGAIVANTIMVRSSTDSYLITLAVLGLACGILALVIRRTIIIVSTAFNGALGLMFGLYALFRHLTPHEALSALKIPNSDVIVFVGCTLMFGIIGSYIQFVTTPKAGEAKEE